MFPGDFVGGRFEVTQRIGEGGLADVYEAIDHETSRRVALKALKPHYAADAKLRQRFAREAGFGLRSAHACVARHAGASYFVMDRLFGATLEETLRRDGPMPAPAAARVVLALTTALAEAHDRGIVHRDVKPANVFLAIEPDGTTCPKLLDFGLAKDALSPEGLEITSAREMLGTPLYMSPEQLMAPHDVDGRADIWSLGIVLHEMVTGMRPFRADSVQQLVVRIVVEPPQVDGRIPPELRAIVERCLAKRAADRYASVRDLGRDLEAVLETPPQTLRSASFEEAGGSVVLGEIAPLFVVGPAPKTKRPSDVEARSRSWARLASSAEPATTLASRSIFRAPSSGPRRAVWRASGPRVAALPAPPVSPKTSGGAG